MLYWWAGRQGMIGMLHQLSACQQACIARQSCGVCNATRICNTNYDCAVAVDLTSAFHLLLLLLHRPAGRLLRCLACAATLTTETKQTLTPTAAATAAAAAAAGALIGGSSQPSSMLASLAVWMSYLLTRCCLNPAYRDTNPHTAAVEAAGAV
jgi:hypothetical protein